MSMSIQEALGAGPGAVARSTVALVVVAALVGASLPARAQQQPAQPAAAAQPSQADLDRARQLFEQGTTAYAEGRYEVAAEAFEASYGIARAPELLYNIGQSYERAGLLPQALEALQRYLAAAPTASDAPAVRERVAVIQRNLRRSQLRVVVTPAGASVRVDGREVGRAPLDAVTIDPGEHVVEIIAEGYRRFRTTFSVALARLHRIEADLAREDEGPVMGGIERHINYAGPVLSWVVAAAALGGGIALGIAASNAADQAQFRDDGDADDARLLAVFADISYGLAVGFTALGLILVLTAEPEEEGEGVTRRSVQLRPGRRRASHTPRLDVGPGGLSLSGTF